MTDNPYKYPYVPIGGIIEWDGTGLTGAPDLSTPEKVAAVYGYGTWERYGIDRVTVGAGGEYPAGSTGGEKEHTLTTNEGPRHSHDLAIRVNKHSGDSGVAHTSIETSTGWYDIVYAHNNAPASCESSGDSQPHNNMQPYIANYRYRRIS